MLFAEFAWGYATAKGEIGENTFAINMVKEMVHQMIALINSHLRYPDEYHTPLSRHVRSKISD